MEVVDCDFWRMNLAASTGLAGKALDQLGQSIAYPNHDKGELALKKIRSLIMLKVKYKGWNCNLQKSRYRDGGRLALHLTDADNGEPIATCTVNVPEAELEEDEVLIKDYSENEGMVAFLEKEGVVKDTGKRVGSGYVQIPVCKLLVQV